MSAHPLPGAPSRAGRSRDASRVCTARRQGCEARRWSVLAISLPASLWTFDAGGMRPP
jgi:hypothetical protein